MANVDGFSDGLICALNVKINFQDSKTFGRGWGF